MPSFASDVPEALVLVLFALPIGLVVVVTPAVVVASFNDDIAAGAEVFPAASVAVAGYVIVPSASAETLIPVAVQFPRPFAVVVTADVVVVPSVAVTVIVAPASAVPDALVFVLFALFTGLVLLLIAIA